MKYTVVIEQPIPEDVRPQLQQLLAERFSLTPEQAQKLAARKGGRLMKPTNEARANVLLQIYTEIGGHVHLEEIPDEPQTSADVPTAIPAVPVMPRSPLHATEFDQGALVVGQGSAPQEADQGVNQIVATAAPDAGLIGSNAAVSQNNSTSSNDDFWASMAKGQDSGLTGVGSDASSAPAVELGGSPLPQITTEPAASTATKPASSMSDLASSNLDTGWADFSSLSVGTNTGNANPAAEPEPAPDMVIQSSTLTTAAVTNDAPDVHQAQRQPLAQRLTLPVMVPLALLTLLSLLTAGLGLNQTHQNTLKANSLAVAGTVAQTLSSDRTAAAQQLSNLVSGNGAGFVQVAYADGTTLFRAKDSTLGTEATKWLSGNATGGTFSGNKGNYQVERVNVYNNAGSRVVKPANESSKDNLSYRVAVGTPVPSNNSLMLLLPLLLGGLLAMALGYWLVQQAAQRIVQPINRLVQAADAISMGDLRQSVTAEANDEVGDLAQALERMRLSLDAAMERLRRRRAKG